MSDCASPLAPFAQLRQTHETKSVIYSASLRFLSDCLARCFRGSFGRKSSHFVRRRRFFVARCSVLSSKIASLVSRSLNDLFRSTLFVCIAPPPAPTVSLRRAAIPRRPGTRARRMAGIGRPLSPSQTAPTPSPYEPETAAAESATGVARRSGD